VSVKAVGYVSNLSHDNIMLYMIISVVRLTSSLSKFLNFGLLITILPPKIDWFLHSLQAHFFPYRRKAPKLWIKLNNTQAFHWKMSGPNGLHRKGI
jgi:hypothetical protein